MRSVAPRLLTIRSTKDDAAYRKTLEADAAALAPAFLNGDWNVYDGAILVDLFDFDYTRRRAEQLGLEPCGRDGFRWTGDSSIQCGVLLARGAGPDGGW